MRVLIVEDEIVSRTKMKIIMRSFGECLVAENGLEAVTLFENAHKERRPFEVVTLDINMPNMKGTEVLSQLREIEMRHQVPARSRSYIIMVTSQLDKENVLACIHTGCDDYIAKPFNLNVIQDKLGKIRMQRQTEAMTNQLSNADPHKAADILFRDIGAALRSGDFSLPALPHISVQFRDLVRQNAELDALAALLKQDIAITSKLISIANSSLYRGYGKIHNVDQALGRLGLSTTEQMVSAFSHQRLYAVENPRYRGLMQRLWRHSLATAFAADLIGRSLNAKLSVDAFTAGLFHDIGALALIRISVDMEACGRFSIETGQEALIETIRTYHTLFGMKLLEKWNFDLDYLRAALYHNNLIAAESVTTDLHLIYLANLIAKKAGFAMLDNEEAIEPAATPSADVLHLTGDQLQEIQSGILSRLKETPGIAE